MRWLTVIALVLGCGSRPRPLGNAAPPGKEWGNCPTPGMTVRTINTTGRDADVCRAVNRVMERQRELGGAFVLEVRLRLPCILTAHLYLEIDGAPIGMASGGSSGDPDGACIETAFEKLFVEHLVPIMRSRAP